MNEILICYMFHGTNLYEWAQNDNSNKVPSKPINKHPASNYLYYSDRAFFYMETQEI